MTATEVVLGGTLAAAYVLLLALRRRVVARERRAERALSAARALAAARRPARAVIRGARRPVRVLRTGLRHHADRVLRPRRPRRRLPVRPANRSAPA
ncbi:hypothetical protein [Catellatospora vulcania]|uniref:hypothetical protein n=1 Tax=Catellatospora vulcania TaxID=1460450 RepID=UPI0012D37E54|nr:hypothetical protein [Catellatospora vulcania]